MATDNIQENGSIVVIGCEVMKAELEMVAQDVVQISFSGPGSPSHSKQNGYLNSGENRSCEGIS